MSTTDFKRKVKVVIAVNDLSMAGAQRLAIDQMRLLDKNVFDLYLISLMQFPGKGDFYYLIPKGVKVFKLDFKGLLDFKGWFQAAKILYQIKPDVVKSSLFFSNTIFRVLKPFFGYKVIAAEHNTDVKKTRFQIFLNKILVPLTYTMVVDSKMVADYLSRTEGIKRNVFTVIYNGVDIDAVKKAEEDFRPNKEEIRKEFGLSPHDKIFLTVSRAVKQKNHELMINSFSLLAEKRGDCRLVIVGDGELLPSLEKQIHDLKLEGKVILAGERKNVHRLYAMSDFFIMTSRHEGFCIVAMEGLAFGMPLISTKVAGIVEYLNDEVNGFFVEHDATDIAEKMNKVASLTSEEKDSFRKQGKLTASIYSLTRYGKEYHDLFLACARS